MFQKIVRRILLAALALVGGVCAGATNRIVRVGCDADYPGFCFMPTNGAATCPQGYYSEYVKTVAAYAGWKVEYVPATWARQLEMVRMGEIDLVGDVPKTEVREREFFFPSHPMGTTRYVVYTRRDFVPRKTAEFQDRRIAVLAGSYECNRIDAWMQMRGIRLQQVVYSTLSEKFEALANREVDLVCSAEYDVSRFGGSFAPLFFLDSPNTYLVCRRDRDDLAAELNEAVQRIHFNNPDFNSILHNRFISESATCVAVPEDELAWLAEHGALRLGFLNDNLPYSGRDGKGNVSGAVVDLMREACASLGLPPSSVDIQIFSSVPTLVAALNAGQVDAVYPAIYGEVAPWAHDCDLSFPVYHSTMVAICRTDITSVDEIQTYSVPHGLLSEDYVRYFQPDRACLVRTTREECMADLRAGRADAILMRRERVMRYVGYAKRHKYTVLDMPHPVDIAFATLPGHPVRYSLLNRFVASVSYGRKVVLLARNLAAMRPSSHAAFWDDYKTQIISSTVAVGALILLLYYLVVVEHRASKMRSLFFSTVSHDIRTPLNAIIGYADLLNNGLADERGRGEATQAISSSGRVLLQLVDDVLDLAKLESSSLVISPEPTDVAALIREVMAAVKPAYDKAGLELFSRIGDLPLLVVDPQRIRQILFNLVGNAVKFTEKGHVTIAADYKNGRFRLSVSDTGVGIAKAEIPHLLRPFGQTALGQRKGGAGLGLAICTTLARRMGGRFTVDSTLGKGSVFTVEIPHLAVAASAPAPTAAAAAPQEEARTFRGKILLVDDSAVNRLVCKALLAKIGLEDVVFAENGRDALAKLTPEIDLVLSDLWMPVMDGEALLRAIRADARFAHLPVYAVTADTQAAQNPANAGFDGILLKPITLDRLQQFFAELPSARADRASNRFSCAFRRPPECAILSPWQRKS